MTRKRFDCFVASLCLGLAVIGQVPAAQAWTTTGHKLVCGYAFERLSPSEQIVLRDLLDGRSALYNDYSDPEDPAYPGDLPDLKQQFMTLCNWPDSAKKRECDHTVRVVDRGESAVTAATFLSQEQKVSGGPEIGCLEGTSNTIDALVEDFVGFATLSGKDRLDALAYLGHFVGDLHQPLHVSFQDDYVATETATSHGSLHYVWDSVLVGEAWSGGSYADITSHFSSDDYEIIEVVEHAYSMKDFEEELRAALLQIADDSFQIAIDDSVGYCGAGSAIDCLRQTANVQITSAYRSQHTGTVRSRLKSAGESLARLIKNGIRYHEEIRIDGFTHNYERDYAYLFVDDQYYRFDADGNLPGGNYPLRIDTYWKGWPSVWGEGEVDAVASYDGDYFLFKDDQFVRHAHGGAPGSPVDMGSQWDGWPSEWESIDAVIVRDHFFYFFSGSRYLRFQTIDVPSGKFAKASGPPKSIEAYWSAWPERWSASSGVDAAFQYGDKMYLFQGTEFVRHSFYEGIDEGYPKKIYERWVGANRRVQWLNE